MIWLHSDCLLLKTSQGDTIPCSAEEVTIELVGEAAATLNPDILHQAARAVLHYFKSELHRDTVTVAEFSAALARVLRNLGLEVQAEEDPPAPSPVAVSDLRQLAAESGRGFELAFFQRLRNEVHLQLERNPAILRFQGLRTCVKQIAAARRWSPRCQHLNDQIVAYLRQCWSADPQARQTALVVR